MIYRIVRVMADCDSKGFTALSEAVQDTCVPMKLHDKSHFKKKFERAVVSVETELGIPSWKTAELLVELVG